MAEIKSLKSQRRSIIKKVEKLYKVATKASLSDAPLKTKNDFFIRYDSLLDDVNKFEDLHLQLVCLIDDNDVAEHDEVQDTFNDMQFAIKLIYKDLYEKTNIQIKQNSKSVRDDSVADRCERVRLPKIEIPKFDGDIKKWPTFFDLYKSLIHESTSLTNIERFQFLVSYLEKDAITVIKNIPITEANYSIAYDALIKRYQNERILVTDYWLSIYQAPTVKTKSSVELRKLLSVFSENLSALDLFQDSVDMWDFTKFNLLFQKMDPSLKTMFEFEYSDQAFPKYGDLYNFLEKQCKALENSQLISKYELYNKSNSDRSNKGGHPSGHSRDNSHGVFSGQGNKPSGHKSFNFMSKTEFPKCIFCKQNAHSLIKCDAFLSAEVQVRHSFVKNKRLCFNCLSSGHSLEKCESTYTCRVCQKRHHTLLHFVSRSSGSVDEKHVSLNPAAQEPRAVNSSGENELKVFSSNIPNQRSVLFATALVSVIDSAGKLVRCRALLDSASQANFISEACVKRLSLQPAKSLTPIQGLNQMSMCASLGTVTLNLSAVSSQTPVYNINAVVLPQICSPIPTVSFYSQKWKYLKDLSLADPEYNYPSDIDILLGVAVFSQIIQPGFIRGQNGGPCALQSSFGWVLFGSVETIPSPAVLSCFTSVNTSLETSLKRFWELESVPPAVPLSPEDETCEKLFQQTCKREPSGRYVVQLPFQVFPPSLGDSRVQALRRFYLLERKLEKAPDLKLLYEDFMRDYIDQGHMVASKPLTSLSSGYFIPHHCVVKYEGSVQKLRVVFDASAKSSNGLSLNENLFVGPKLQSEITSILLNFRLFSVVFTADIRQMYRQILVAPEHRDFQRILWRFSSSEPVTEYQLNTVTYGVSASPYLAIRSVHQLVVDQGSSYPLAERILKNNMYVDDLLAGAFTLDDALKMQSQVIEMLSLGCFELRKWTSNNSELLKCVPTSHQQPISFSEKDGSGTKVLGLQWSPVSDCFSYVVKPISNTCTKRNILSDIARIYDPLGLLSPTILLAKSLIQKLWLQGLGWDAAPSADITNQWDTYRSQLPSLSLLSIPRRLIRDEKVGVEIHGFCDASEMAYAAVVYLRQTLSDDSVTISLVYAKNKVSPLKRVSLPRLELCAASLLADCLGFVIPGLSDLKITKVYAWSDSTVALTWLRSPPYRWKTFIANRVSHIQEIVPPDCWRHVDGKSNPADCASRGVFPDQLVSHPLWWAGPPWLRLAESCWPCQAVLDTSKDVDLEERKIVCMTTHSVSFLDQLLEKYSSLNKLQRIVAYCLRFINLRVRNRPAQRGALCYSELYNALVVVVKMVQHQCFSSDLQQLQQKLLCSKPLRKLAPFLDEFGVIRVGGRLRNADIAYEAKHPMLLPRSHRLTCLIIEHFHNENLHPGPQTLQYLISQQFWILSARRAIRHVLSKCFRCFRTNPISLTPYMSDLPAVRVSQVKAFTQCGVDFAGPISIVLHRHRGIRSQKAYICVFVCLSTKAVHLEAVSDLTSEAFLAAFRRFVARRGRCTDVYSDNGTNFVGANNLLLSYCKDSCDKLTVKWHFNPPASPHWGGIWERAVRSVKTHLVRVIGSQILSFEELTTLLAQIESLLNSRPLCSLSTDPNDFSSLTPGHFLTLAPLTAPPDEDLSMVKSGRLNRWQLIQQLHQHFWKRWHVEYLNTLQTREKWNTPQSLLSVGTLVVIKDSNSPPLKWPLGRVERLYPGPDTIVRVAQVRTSKGLLDRPLVKLCPLPDQ